MATALTQTPVTDVTYRTYGYRVLLLPTAYYRVFLLSLYTTPKRNSNSAVTSLCTPQRGMKLLYLLVQTTTGTYSTSLDFPSASDVSQLIVYLLYPVPTPRLF